VRQLLLPAMLGVAAVFAGLSPQEAEARSCEAVAADVASASSAADTGSLIALYNEAREADPPCSDRYRICLGRAVAHGFVDRAYGAHDAGRPEAEIESLLVEAIDWSQTWKVLLAFAELADEQKRYDDAARYYQAALNDLDDNIVCPGEEAGIPDERGLRAIFERATVAGLLSKDFVEPPRDRSNDPGGIFLSSVRGVAPVERSLPVEFEYDSAAFTPKGARAAEALAGYIVRNKEKYPAVRLSGHTDERGSAPYNCALSERRLAAIADYLYAHGVPVEIAFELVPQGEHVPIHLDDPSRYSAEEIYQVNRRVALIEGHEPIAGACQ